MTEADYVCFLAKNISLGLYQEGGFVVLPRLIKGVRCVHFPYIDLSSKFWNDIKRCKARNLSDSFPKTAVDEAASKLPHNISSYIINKGGYDVEILETEYGTCGSYFTNKNNIFITQRSGNTNEDLERTFLLATVRIKNKDDAEIGTINWHKRQAIVDYQFGKQEPKLSGELIRESNEYLMKLGFPQNNSLEKINFNEFTKQEEDLVNYMISAKGKIVSFDTTAQILWGENSYDKYSPAAMAKVVENIRTKIKNQGINKEVIFTKRGKGYFI